MDNEISIREADLILEKLYSEAIPVVAYYVCDRVKVMRRGIVTGVSSEVGLVVAEKESVTQDDYLAVRLGSPAGASCRFWYGDVRELPDETRSETVEHLGESVLLIRCPDGGRLRLYFSLKQRMETTADPLEALRDKFEIKEWTDAWHLFCKRCALAYELKKTPDGTVHSGNILSLLNHAASHKGRR